MSPLSIALDFVSIAAPSWNSLLLQSQETIAKLNEITIPENKKVENEDDPNYADISVSLYADIVRITKGDKKAMEVLTAKAINTEKWIKYAFHCLTDKSSQLLPLDNETMELVNGVAKLVFPEAGKIYENAGAANLRKYDAKGLITDKVKFILDKYSIKDRFDEEMVAKAKEKFAPTPKKKPEPEVIIEDKPVKKKNKPVKVENEIIVVEHPKQVESKKPEPVIIDPQQPATTTVNGRYDRDGFFHPIFTKTPEQIRQEITDMPIAPPIMPKEIVDKYNRYLSPLLNGKKFYYTYDNFGNVILNVADGYMVTPYMIDDGTIMGGEHVSVMGNYVTPAGIIDTMFVDVVKHPNIASRILSGKMYILTPEEATEANADLFQDQSVYRFIDFSNTGFIDDPNVDNEELGRILSGIVNLNSEHARLRFDNFITVHNFSLVSDTNCKSPLKGVTSEIIVLGVKYIIDNDSVTKLIGGNGTKYQI